MDSQNNILNIQFAIIRELGTSVRLIELGLGEIQNLSMTNDFYFLPFQLLVQGFERFMKMYICIGEYNKSNKFPPVSFFKNLGHDLELILNKIMSNYYSSNSNPMLMEDEDFLSHNQEIKKLLHILSEFGKTARYYNFDVIGNKPIKIDPEAEWNAFENEIIAKQLPFQTTPDQENIEELISFINVHIVVIFERFMAALSRQFSFNTIGDLGKSLSMTVHNFAMLDDKTYGHTDYRKHTTQFTQNIQHGHRRTMIDRMKRWFNPNYKYRIVKQQDFEGDWPFLSDHVTVESRNKYWYIVTIDNYDFALNGVAKGKYKIANPHEAGMAIIGKSLQPFIQIAKQLS